MRNKDLKQFYDSVYRKGEGRHYTKLLFSHWKAKPEEGKAVLKEIQWKGKRVLEVGCGTGTLAEAIAQRGAESVLGIDYSAEAIGFAARTHRRANLEFRCMDAGDLRGKYDVVVSVGTIEHTDDPFAFLRSLARFLVARGSLIITCPNWINPRGYMLLTLWFLFRARITLADLHYLTPKEMEEWARRLRMRLSWRTVDHEWSQGKKLVQDFARRLPNVCRDSRLKSDPGRIRAFTQWIETHVPHFSVRSKSSGAVGIYHLHKS